MEHNLSFEYTYSADQRREVEAIRKKYLPREEDKIEQLRRLHSIPTQKAQAASIAIGVLGALVLGTGMSLCMTELGAAMGHLAMVIGILVGVLGLIMVALAYPVYNTVLKKERQRIAPELLRLSEELLQ
jgi:uncharacterized membrane protein YccF (DUF307 family)